jgi:hypothetical protein
MGKAVAYLLGFLDSISVSCLSLRSSGRKKIATNSRASHVVSHFVLNDPSIFKQQSGGAQRPRHASPFKMGVTDAPHVPASRSDHPQLQPLMLKKSYLEVLVQREGSLALTLLLP